MCTALVSSLTGNPVRADVAMTGGNHPAWRGAAHRWSQGETAGGPPWWHQACADPEENERDLEEIPANVKQDLEIYPVRWIDEVLALALQDNPQGFERVSVV